jgi:hypothetical protein
MSEQQPTEQWTFKQWCEAVGFYDSSKSIAEHYRRFIELVHELPHTFMREITDDKFGRWLSASPIQQRDEALCAIGVLQRIAQTKERLVLNGINFVDHSRLFLRSTAVCAQPFAELSAQEIESLLNVESQSQWLSANEMRRQLYRRVFPSPYYPIIGREREIDELINRLTDKKAPIVCVVGTAGDGKTNLTWHTICRAVDSGLFSAFDWVTDRSMYVDGNGNPRPTNLPPLTTSTIYNSMIQHFEWDDLKLRFTNLAQLCAKRFREGHYCLVLDNMETPDQLERFLHELSPLVQPTPPLTSRILITSRVEVSAPFVDYMPIRGLELEAAIQYVEHIEGNQARITLRNADRELLARATGGNPLFIQIALARYAKNGRNMKRVVDQMQQGSSFFSTFQNLFSSLYQALSPAAKQVALDAAQYTEEITRDDLEADAAHHLADAEQFEQALTELVDQHVLKPSDIPGYYTIHPLVRAYLVRILERNDSY